MEGVTVVITDVRPDAAGEVAFELKEAGVDAEVSLLSKGDHGLPSSINRACVGGFTVCQPHGHLQPSY